MISHALCESAKLEFLAGLHRSTDRYMMALYEADATIGAASREYTQSGEVAGEGYDRGGLPIPGWRVTADGIVFDDVVWPVVSVTAKGALIYNSSRRNRAIAAVDFGQDVASTRGEFRVNLEAPLVQVV